MVVATINLHYSKEVVITRWAILYVRHLLHILIQVETTLNSTL